MRTRTSDSQQQLGWASERALEPSSLSTGLLPQNANANQQQPPRSTVTLSSSSPEPMSRPTPSASASSSSLPRVHGHDHTRPLPPPRLVPEATGLRNFANSPVTVPLTPLANSASFRGTSPPLVLQQQQQRNAVADVNSVEVTLAVPRPDGERAVNEYVETPFRPNNIPDCPKCPKSERRAQQRHHHKSRHRQSHALLLQSSTNAVTSPAVTKQPVSFTKEPAGGNGAIIAGRGVSDAAVAEAAGLSIMCEHCGRCRCESCREPPPLPSRWLCDNACFCSAETALDYASCLCCAKGLFYHCADSAVESEAGSCADEPCSCTGSRKTARWACLGALTLVLPCLLCYWPLKGCVTVCEACYARHAAQGCRCEPAARHHHHVSVLGDSRDPEKRLLDPVTPEL